MTPLPPDRELPSSPITIARRTLGERLEERSGAFFLDGRPIKTGEMVKAANRVRVTEGREQFGPEHWRV